MLIHLPRLAYLPQALERLNDSIELLERQGRCATHCDESCLIFRFFHA